MLNYDARQFKIYDSKFKITQPWIDEIPSKP